MSGKIASLLISAALILILFPVGGCSEPQKPRQWQPYVTACLDTLIGHGTDRYGPVHSPMLMAVIDVNTLEAPPEPQLYDSLVRCEPDRLHRRGQGGTKAWYDQITLRCMYLTSELTGETKYARPF